MSAKKVAKFLILRSDGECRIVTKYPRLRFDEFAFRLNVTIPAGWGAVQSDSIELAMPEPPEGVAVHVDPAPVGEA
jgi:hypothetical protein